ncbi:MAG TPA: hypothetical protein VE442_17680, partial [Jatrophihabitans sp.]|nr:hypothetical protein [Jatrophihabitans sp.]
AAVLVQGSAPPVRHRPGAPVALAGGEPVHICLDAAVADDAMDPRVRAAISGLLADGVPTKAAANALAALTGRDRRRAYEIILAWPNRPEGRLP